MTLTDPAFDLARFSPDRPPSLKPPISNLFPSQPTLRSSSSTMDINEVHDTVIVDDTMTDVNRAIEQGDLEVTPKTEEEYAQSMLTLRAIVSTKEAGVIIGKSGKNVADLRDETGVKAGVSKVVPGVHDRVLTVTGPLQGAARAYAIVAKSLVEGVPQMGMGGIIPNNGTHREYYSICRNSC